MKQPFADLTAAPDLLEHAEGTGPKRSRRPVYLDMLPPCNNACPAGENIQAWLSHVQAGRYREAWETLIADNPLPGVHGRVCYHPCEDGCNRGQVDNPVSIHAVERFLGDEAIRQGWKIKITAPHTGKRVLVIGGGPSGLSAAYHLTRLGHEVEIYEAGRFAAGIMDFGTHIGKKTEIPARDAGKIFDAVNFLRDVELGNTPKIGRRVAIYGGGNTAMDAARTAKRLGAGEALIIYRRDREHMPAHDFEADEALSEGVKIHWLRSIKEISSTSITVEVMRVENGKPVPTGEYETLEADALILALGQDTDTGFLQNIPGIEFKDDGTVMVGNDMMTGYKGIFAGGDMVPSERTVTIAVGHGKKAARYIDAFLRESLYEKPEKHPVVGFERLHVWYQTHAPASEQPHKKPEEAATDFTEIVGGLSEEEARYESQRCYSCGNCFECDGCFGSCPEDAVIKLGPGLRYQFNYNQCTGCAVCYEQCPCHAIEMVNEPA